MGIIHRVRRLLAHTRRVPTQVYRLMVVAWAISGVIQFIYGPPNSVMSQSGEGWFDLLFVSCQLGSAVLVLVGLYLVEENTQHATRLHLSLTIELIGSIGIQTVIAVNVAAIIYNENRVPAAGTTWMSILFAVWLLFRQCGILRTQRRLTR